ncbi:MAG: MmcQ/YjbR family DNA-binding protein [Dokdonella sp.]
MKIAHVRQFALALPEAAELPHHHYASFRVAGKIFVTVPPEGTHIHVFVGEEVREPALAMYPSFVEKLEWGNKIVGLRIALAEAHPEVVVTLVSQAWQTKAPKRLLSA